MALFKRFFYQKPPDRLLEISERVYVFDCCLSTNVLKEHEYKFYMGGVVAVLKDHYPDSSFKVLNFREGDRRTQISEILSKYDIMVTEYPRQYEGCSLLPLEMIHHILIASESWLSHQQNVLLMHCERGAWPVLAFMLAALYIFRKQYSGEQKTLEMVQKQAPIELLRLLTPFNPQPSQLRYLQYISRRTLVSDWPPSDTTLVLDYVILRFPPLFGEKGCVPVIRIYGQDLSSTTADRSSKLLSTSFETKKRVDYHQAEDIEVVKIDIDHRVHGDVVLEYANLDHVREEIRFRVMFNTTFVRSNILMLNRDEVDVLWDAREQMSKDFRVEVIFSFDDALPTTLPLPTGHRAPPLHPPQPPPPPPRFGTQTPPPPPPSPPRYAARIPQITAPFLKEFENLKIQLEDIKSATNNFAENQIIGEGGFGKVYLGEISHSRGRTMGAFKRLDSVHGQGDPEFWKEILMLSGYKHENLISLLGFCDEGGERVLVYEYASNGSLDHHLSSTHLTWRRRIQICLDAAKGLRYLHDDKGTMQRVLHRDIKSANILLDDNWNAKVSDMGLSKTGPANQTHTFVITRNIVGTPGYCDPQYMKKYTLSKESDVYSFGVVLFEVLCGKLCYNYINSEINILVPMWKKAYKQKRLHEIVFQGLSHPMDSNSLEMFSSIAFQCLKKSREERPKMADVVERLETALEFESRSEAAR